jgi:prostatic aicd phosphatase
LSPISLVGAGFLGAGLTLAVAIMAFTTLAILGLLSFGKKRKEQKMPAADDEVRSLKKLFG